MQTSRILLLVPLCALVACSKGTSPSKSAAARNSTSVVAAQPSDAASSGNLQLNTCETITAADVAGIITAPVTGKAGPDPTREGGSDPATCVYRAQSGADVTISLAQGDTAKGAWMLATTYNGTKTPLAGVGEQALYGPVGTVLIARKGDLSCRVDVVGYDNADAMDSITKDRGAQLAGKLGALCSKAFSAY